MLLSWSLFNRLDVSIPLYTAGSALIVPWPEEGSRLLIAPIHPFQPMVLSLNITLKSVLIVYFVLVTAYKFIYMNRSG